MARHPKEMSQIKNAAETPRDKKKRAEIKKNHTKHAILKTSKYKNGRR